MIHDPWFWIWSLSAGVFSGALLGWAAIRPADHRSVLTRWIDLRHRRRIIRKAGALLRTEQPEARGRFTQDDWMDAQRRVQTGR